MFKSNASLSKEANNKTKLAEEATAKAKDSDPASHREAASAHYSAVWAHQSAGNTLKADAHKKQAKYHDTKAAGDYETKSFADNMGRLAEGASKQADMASVAGKDKDELRSTKEMHQDASKAHDKAAKAYELAGDDKASKYHAAKSQQHQDCCQ